MQIAKPYRGQVHQERMSRLGKLIKIRDDFNRRFPVGTPVILRKDSGNVVTSVRAPAEILQGHSAVGWFVGVSGCYSIEDGRVSAMPATVPASA